MYYQPEPIEIVTENYQPPVLGEWRIVQATAIKVHGDSELCTQWKRQQIDRKSMMFIGVRQVREGRMVENANYYYEDGLAVDVDYTMVFQALRFITVWLFVPDAYKKPIHVLPQDALIRPDRRLGE